jgi:hypothetical protein
MLTRSSVERVVISRAVTSIHIHTKFCFLQTTGVPFTMLAATAPSDDIFPVHYLCQATIIRDSIVSYSFRYDGVVDVSKLRSALWDLLSGDDWRRYGGRLRCNKVCLGHHSAPDLVPDVSQSLGYWQARITRPDYVHGEATACTFRASKHKHRIRLTPAELLDCGPRPTRIFILPRHQ